MGSEGVGNIYAIKNLPTIYAIKNLHKMNFVLLPRVWLVPVFQYVRVYHTDHTDCGTLPSSQRVSARREVSPQRL